MVYNNASTYMLDRKSGKIIENPVNVRSALNGSTDILNKANRDELVAIARRLNGLN